MRLIDADELRKKFVDFEFVDGVRCDVDYYALKTIKDAPTIDAVPLKHGRWVWNDYGGFGNYHCSECRKICICNGDYDYCPNCGARMDKDETD